MARLGCADCLYYEVFCTIARTVGRIKEELLSGTYEIKHYGVQLEF